MAEYGNPNAWQSEVVVCKGGLVLDTDALTQGTTMQGSAKILQNFECALEGGYRRISGYIKWDSTVVPGLTTTPVLGVKSGFGGVFATRLNSGSTSNDVYFSTGGGWTKINTDTRAGAVSKARFIIYSISGPTVVGCDGLNPAFKYSNSTYTLLNGTGSPANPKYAEMFNASLALAGYTNNGGPQCVTLTAPNTDTDFSAADGAVEINVGDTIVGLKNFRNQLYVFCTNRIFKIVTDPTTTFAVEQVTTALGCVSGDTVQESGGDLLYLAPDGFRTVAGTYNIGDVDLSLESKSIQPIIRDDILGDTGIDQYSSCLVRSKSQYRCFFYDSTVSKGNALGIIGKVVQGSYLSGFNQTFVTYEWSTTSGIQPYCADSYFDGTTEHSIIGDPANGFVYLLESGNDFDGTPIQAAYQSPYLTFKDASLRKVMQKATIYSEAEGANMVNLNLLFDFQNTGVLQPAANVLTFSGTFTTYGAGIYDTSAYAEVLFPVFKQNLIGSGFTTAFQFTSTGGAPYRIDSYQIIYSNKGRR